MFFRRMSKRQEQRRGVGDWTRHVHEQIEYITITTTTTTEALSALGEVPQKFLMNLAIVAIILTPYCLTDEMPGSSIHAFLNVLKKNWILQQGTVSILFLKQLLNSRKGKCQSHGRQCCLITFLFSFIKTTVIHNRLPLKSVI